MAVAPVLTHREASAVYDRIGRWQDIQDFYEAPALTVLKRHARFDSARRVFEFGCGTGRFAHELLTGMLPPTAQYLGVDSSPRMVQIAQQRLRPFADRAQVRLSAGSPVLPDPDGAYDRFVATYVLDLLSTADAAILLAEVGRMLTADGYLCLVSLTYGQTAAARVVSWAWERAFTLRPQLVAGCRPMRLLDLLSPARWTIWHHERLTVFAMSSEIVVASPVT
jgi:SAM-dependent methyltransferase